MKKKLILATVILAGILLGSTINYITSDISQRVSDYTSVIDSVRFKTDAQQPVVKAFRVYKYVEYQEHLYLKMEFIKLRECDTPISFSIAYEDHDRFSNLTNVNFFDDLGLAVDRPRLVPVDPINWNTTYWIKLPLDFRDKRFYINTTYACPTLFIGENVEEAKIKQADPTFSNAIDMVVRAYGPFKLSEDEKSFAGRVDKFPF